MSTNHWTGKPADEVRALIRADGGTCSDGPIENFAGGWAALCFVGDSAHYWSPYDCGTEVIGPHGPVLYWRTLCGGIGTTSAVAPALGAGNYPRCQHCERKAPRK